MTTRLPEYLRDVFAADDIARKEFATWEFKYQREKQQRSASRNPVEHVHREQLIIEVLENNITMDEILFNQIENLRAELQELRTTKLPVLQGWTLRMHYEGELVLHGGGLYQACTNTWTAPGHDSDWQVVAAPGEDGVDGRSYDDRNKVVDLPSNFILRERGGKRVA